MPAEAHYCPGNPECTLIDEYGRHLRGEAALRVIDFGPVPTLFPGIVLQPSEKHDLVARNMTQAFVRILAVEAFASVGFLVVLHPKNSSPS